MATFQESIALIKETYNIVELVEQENVSLSVSGPGEFKGLCPFHSEKTPSFKVSEPFQNYYCFGCQAKGDIFSFIQETRGCTFMDAVKYLAANKGIELDIDDGSSEDGPKVDLKKLYSLLKDSRDYYRQQYDMLDASHAAKREISKRGLDINDEVYGFAPEKYGALYEHLKNLGYSEALMLQSELISKNDQGQFYDFFYGRLMITLADFSGRPVSYSARKLFETDTRAKFVNGKASPIFQKKATLFNLHNAKRSARQKKEIILTEGPFDTKALEKSGFDNATASCGTAFTEEHLKSAMQLAGENGTLIFSFDGDEAGVEAALKTFKHFPIAHSMSKIALFPEGKDPCDQYIEHGAEGVAEIINSAIPITDFVLKSLANSMEITDMSSRYRYVKTIISEYLVVMTDQVLLDYMLRRLSIISGVDVAQIKDLYKDTKSGNKNRQVTQPVKDEEELHMQVQINSLDDSDVCFVSAFSMLVRFPEQLSPLSKGVDFPPKFIPFLQELVGNIKRYKESNREFRFIPEEYTDSDFAKYLQNVSGTKQFLDDTEEMQNHYKHIIKTGEKFYKNSVREAEKSNILAAMSEAKSNDELFQMLKLLEEQKTR